MARCSPKYAATPPMMEVRPVAIFMTRARPRDIPECTRIAKSPTDPVRNLVRGDGEGSHQAQRKTREESRGNQDTVERVMHAIADDDEHARRRSATIVVAVVVTVIARGMRVAVMRLMPVDHAPHAHARAHSHAYATTTPASR